MRGGRTAGVLLLACLLGACTTEAPSDKVSAGSPARADASLPRGDFDAGPVGVVDAANEIGLTDTGALGAPERDGGGLDAASDVTGSGSPDPADASVDAAAAGSLWASPGLPPWDAATLAHVDAVRTRGAALGNQSTVFAKVGDSITAWPPFLYAIGNGDYGIGAYGALAATIAFFASTPLFDGSNTFNRTSDAAEAGWTCADALGPPDAVQQEIGEIHPMYAVVMLGTNDIEDTDVSTYQQNLTTIVAEAESLGTVVVLSTIPDRRDFEGAAGRVSAFNGAIEGIVAARHLPWIDLFSALAALPNEGLGPDLVHPSIEPGADGGVSPPDQPSRCDFTAAGLSYGFDVRNLLTVQALDRLRRIP